MYPVKQPPQPPAHTHSRPATPAHSHSPLNPPLTVQLVLRNCYV